VLVVPKPELVSYCTFFPSRAQESFSRPLSFQSVSIFPPQEKRSTEAAEAAGIDSRPLPPILPP